MAFVTNMSVLVLCGPGPVSQGAGGGSLGMGGLLWTPRDRGSQERGGNLLAPRVGGAGASGTVASACHWGR